MRSVVCPHCNETLSVPDDLARAHCVRCGQAIALSEIHVSPKSPFASSTAIQEDPPDRLPPVLLADSRHDPSMKYGTWEEFRTNSPVVQHHLAQFATRPLPDLRAAECLPIPGEAPNDADFLRVPVASCSIPGETNTRSTGWLLIACGVGFFSIFAWQSSETAWYAVFLFGLGAWFAFGRRGRPPVTLWFFEEGVLRQCGSQFQSCAWDEVDGFQVNQQTRRPRFWIRVRNQDAEFGTGRNPAILPIMEYVETKLSAAQFLPRLERIFLGESVAFGAVTLNRNGLGGPRFFAYWGEIERVVSDADYLFVVCRGQADWHQVRYGDVSFPVLVLAISHVLIQEEKHVPG